MPRQKKVTLNYCDGVRLYNIKDVTNLYKELKGMIDECEYIWVNLEWKEKDCA